MQYARVQSRLAAAVGVILLGALSACSKQGAEPAAAATNATIGKANVDGARIENADNEPGSWMSHGRTYSVQRYSPLTQISKDNVGKLGLAWFADMDTNRGQEATPIVVDGVIYVSTAWSKVKAYHAKTGKALWQEKVGSHVHSFALNDAADTVYAAGHGKVWVYKAKA